MDDDPLGIPDDAILYRRITWQYFGAASRYELGETPKLNQNCFQDFPFERCTADGYDCCCLSLDLAVLVAAHGRTPASLCQAWGADYGLARVEAGALRRLQRGDGTAVPQGFALDPTEQEPWHVLMFDLSSPAEAQRPGGARKAVAAAAEWVIPLVASQAPGAR
jgi:hypothetical protein